jgi:hypothetical protein
MKKNEGGPVPQTPEDRRQELVRLLGRILAKRWIREQNRIIDPTALEKKPVSDPNGGDVGPDARR